MKSITKYILLIGLVSIQFNCKESFLDKGLLGELEETNFMQNQSDAILATNAIYNELRDWRYFGGFPILDIMSDESRKGSNPTDAIQIQAFETFTFTPSDEPIRGWYSTLYIAIKRANIVIERAPDIEMDEVLKRRLIGEAKFLRALTYFFLGRGFGGVPIVTETSPDRIIPRNTVAEVYDLIEQDLLDAIGDLPERSDYPPEDLGRATRGAAKGLLTKVYLFQGDFSKAESMGLEVINSGEYSLEPDFERVFSKDGEFGLGSIFEVAGKPEGFAEGGLQYGNTQGVRNNPNRGWGFNRPSWTFLESFEEGDPRKEGSVIFLGETLDGITIGGDEATPDTTFDADGNILEIECYNQKVWVPGTGPIESWDSNVRVLRLADVLLMVAEASNELGNTSDALLYLNRVRERARGGNAAVLPDITETNQAELRKIIINERRAELGLELHRFFDLVRTGFAEEFLGPLGFQNNKHELLPIPQSEIDLSEGALTQNPGW